MTIPQIPQLVYTHCEGRDTLPDAVRAYGEACYRAGMERAAVIAQWLPDGSGHFGNVAAAIRAEAAKEAPGQWGSSIVSQPAYQAEQREKNREARALMDLAAKPQHQ